VTQTRICVTSINFPPLPLQRVYIITITITTLNHHGNKTYPISSSMLTLDLHQLISDQCPNAIKASEIKNFFGRKVAIVPPIPPTLTPGRVHLQRMSAHCSSMSIYQFMIAVRQQDGQQLMSETGETTSYPPPPPSTNPGV
jgi:hypothetical protein